MDPKVKQKLHRLQEKKDMYKNKKEFRDAFEDFMGEEKKDEGKRNNSLYAQSFEKQLRLKNRQQEKREYIEQIS